MTKTFTMKKIAEAIDGELIGDGSLTISRPAHPAEAHHISDLALAMDASLLPLLTTSKARAAVISTNTKAPEGSVDACILVSRPRVALAKITNLFAENISIAAGVHPTAILEEGVKLGENVSIGAHAFVGTKSTIGSNSILHPQTYIGPDVTIGDNALIYSGARIGANVQIGKNSIIHFNASIGADGFSFVTPQIGSVETAKATGIISSVNSELIRIASLGSVILGDNVEIGANTSIDRGTIASTRIGTGTKIDNQVQIGHNVVIGENCMICGRVGIAGSCTIGDRVVLGGAVGIADHIRIGEDAMVMAMSGVAGHVPPRTIVGGIPAVPRQRLIENIFNISRIKSLLTKLDSLTLRIDVLEQHPKSD